MNREIVFRGRTKSGEWAEGDLIQIDGNRFIRVHESKQRFQVDPPTVGQFTGLYDANKQRIFEGDILEHYHANRYVVWGDYCVNDNDYLSRTTGFFTYNPKYKSIRCLNCFTIEQRKVIGNIHDNPELMEVKDE